jgi:hypothetical protein
LASERKFRLCESNMSGAEKTLSRFRPYQEETEPEMQQEQKARIVEASQSTSFKPTSMGRMDMMDRMVRKEVAAKRMRVH